ncbi:MAG: peptidoglycan recognition protein family protein [Gloeocapsa sp. UFS-A4-WI-NPMV-4B04]|jgi:hypothetical protein|nr:peptidoglycan recognition protein family protein [Gloeocapsa sp. UFS-A4-WI-NPMV-4B04]
MIAVTTIPQEIQVKQTFTIAGTASPDLKKKTITLTVDNEFKTLGNVVNDNGSWQIEFQFLQPGDRRLKISIGDESETRMIKVILAPPRLRFTSIPTNIKTEEKFTLSGEADGFDNGDQLLLKVDDYVVARPLVNGGKWQAIVLLHSGGKRLFELESSEQDRVQIQLDVESSDLEVVARSVWFDNKPPAKSLADLPNPKRITLHHFFIPSDLAKTQTEEIQRMRNVRRDQMTNTAQGFSDIGYHFVIMASGRIYEGRPEGKRGAHDVINDGFGIAFDGDYTTRTITDEQFKSAVALCTKLCQRMGIKDPTELVSTPTASFGTKNLPRIIGHRDRFSTACPGVSGGTTVRLDNIRQAVKQALN